MERNCVSKIAEGSKIAVSLLIAIGTYVYAWDECMKNGLCGGADSPREHTGTDKTGGERRSVLIPTRPRYL